jgi:DMSO reductase family type II enzyme heme b subunit
MKETPSANVPNFAMPVGWAVTGASLILFMIDGCQRSSSPAPSETAHDMAKQSADERIVDVSKLDEIGSSNEAPEAETPSVDPLELGRQLYAQHCAACHGEQGDGLGLAAAWLFPKPRDFRAGRFRLTSTDNHVPTRDDLHAVLLRGMPGSAMPPWAHLSLQEREALVDEILRLRREGARDFYVKFLRDEEELTDEEMAAEDVQEELQGYVDDSTTPGATTDVPEIGPPEDEAAVRGRSVYEKFGCISCHGEMGRGDGVQEMVDEEKLPTSPRDFTLGIFKGDPAPAFLYRRIAFGMPGTPMPGSTAMMPDETVDLVHYIRSLSTESQRQSAVLRREKIVVARVSQIPNSAEEALWEEAAAVNLRLTPLWWRNDPHPELAVQAVHDGKTIAVRLSWRDDADNQHANRSEAFEDAAAMELYSGPAEPFLGMGDKNAPVDVWFWDADRQGPSATVESTYPNAVTDVFPFSETSVAGPELDRAGARTADQPVISLPARASGNQIVPVGDESGGSSLHVGGPGTVTFRVPQSQLVWARGEWRDGQWRVLMKRPLAAPSEEDGVSLAPGQHASAAFAVWNGAHQDRNGQKLVTIWQDFELEE